MIYLCSGNSSKHRSHGHPPLCLFNNKHEGSHCTRYFMKEEEVHATVNETVEKLQMNNNSK